MQYKHLFGPVHSRRLGRSLGVDMIPFKTCNCNCVYCECGGACTVENERKEYVPADELIDELRHFLSPSPILDYVTFAGSGEPTLNTALGAVVDFVKAVFPTYKTALLTNGTLFFLPEVRQAAMRCDLVLPSLDAISDEAFQQVNRPHPGCDVRRMIEGLLEFSREFRGQLWVEVFIVPGVNDTREEISLMREALLPMKPGRVQLNSLDRPGACDWVKTATSEQLSEIARLLQPLPVEIISRKALSGGVPSGRPPHLDDTVIHQLRRRPATIEELSVICGATINDINDEIGRLIEQRRCSVSMVEGRRYYALTAPDAR